MQRNRQALGVISTNNLPPSKPAQAANGGALKQQQPAAAVKQASINDENEMATQARGLKTSKSSDAFDFDIYQEDVKVTQQVVSSKQRQSSVTAAEIKLKESMSSNLDYIESIAVYSSHSHRQEEEKEEEDEDRKFMEDNLSDGDASIESIPDSDEDDDDDDCEGEEEGVSRLNKQKEQQSEEAGMVISDQELISMMDSSVVHSPMVMDDTIKFQSHLTDLCDEEEEEEEEEDSAELDEDEKRKQMLCEQENLIMSCLEYKDDILAYMRQQEQVNRPKVNYMKKQQDINSSMRCILVDWLVEVCEEYRLNLETLYLAVNYTERFLSQMSVLRGKLQLVGTASMYIAAKYEEITPPDVAEFVYITDDTYTKKQVLRMEHLLLKVLDFNMNAPTVNWFLNHYLRFNKRHFSLTSSDDQQRFESLARYVAELTLLDVDTFIGFLPSQIAASAVYLALACFDRPWTKQIADGLGYGHDLAELRDCIKAMHCAMQEAPGKPQQAIVEKYKSAKHHHVSLTSPPKQLPASCFNDHDQ